MPELEQRIQQWEKMASQAGDDMAFFSLGSAYKEANRLEEADLALAKALEYNPNMSRAYQLRGQVLIKLEKNKEAASLLNKGYTIAAGLGDVMPQKAIGALLKKLGEPVPEVAEEKQEQQDSLTEADKDTIVDRRTGRRQKKLADPPMRGPVGELIYENFGQDTWNMWIGQGTKVINELGLDFSKDEDQKTYEQYMLQWLQISEEEIESSNS